MTEKPATAPTLEDAGMYLFAEDVDVTSCSKVIRFILEKNLAPNGSKPDNITLIINSPGGDVNSAFALIDTIKSSRIPIYTVGLGEIVSCGLMLFMAGKRGHRVITPNTSIMSHQFSWHSFGKEHELFARVKEFSMTQQRVLDHYKKCTGMSEKKIRQYLLPAEDVWLSAEEAVDLGVADRIVTVY